MNETLEKLRLELGDIAFLDQLSDYLCDHARKMDIHGSMHDVEDAADCLQRAASTLADDNED
jgi:hypothetical protein